MNQSPPLKTTRRRPGLAALLGFVGVLALTGGSLLAEGEVRVAVEVTDEDGNPVAGLTVVIEPDDDIPAREMTTNKKGRAAIPNLRPGQYRPELAGDDYRMLSIKFSARMSDNSRQTFSEEDVPRNGPPNIDLIAFSRTELDIRVGKAVAAPTPTGGALHGAQDAQGQLERLNALFDLQQWDELIVEADALLAEDPELGGAHYLRGVALWRTGSLDEAEQAIVRAESLIPEQPGIHGVLGALYLDHATALKQAGDDVRAATLARQAAESLRRQLEATPGIKTHLTNVVIALELAGDVDDAMAALRELIAAEPEDPRPHLRLAELQIDAGQAEAAVETLTAIPGAGADIIDLLYNAAVVMWNEDKLDAAVATMARAIELDPDNALLHQLKGRALIAKGETAEGIAELEEYIRLSPEDQDVGTEKKLIEALKQQG